LPASFRAPRLAEPASKCGRHRTIIGSAERGERDVAILNARLIVQVLRVRLAELFSDPEAKRHARCIPADPVRHRLR
jgi:hypothetical protein